MTALTLMAPIFVTIFAWWFSTGLILLMVRAPSRYYVPLLIGLGVFAGLAFWGIIASAQNQSYAAVYCGFLCTLLVWGWHEASFLMGKITGPRPAPCPQGVRGVQRFMYAVATLIYHEIALFLTLIMIGIATWGSSNQIALWTFGILFLMRLSAKFNIFLGVPNLTDEFFPDHLAHLKSYLPKRAMNALMPISIIACLMGGFWQWSFYQTLDPQSDNAIALVIVMTLTALGLIEHIFMITKLPDALLWRWAAPAPRDKPSQHDSLKN